MQILCYKKEDFMREFKKGLKENAKIIKKTLEPFLFKVPDSDCIREINSALKDMCLGNSPRCESFVSFDPICKILNCYFNVGFLSYHVQILPTKIDINWK
jgi:hypothetical protein